MIFTNKDKKSKFKPTTNICDFNVYVNQNQIIILRKDWDLESITSFRKTNALQFSYQQS